MSEKEMLKRIFSSKSTRKWKNFGKMKNFEILILFCEISSIPSQFLWNGRSVSNK